MVTFLESCILLFLGWGVLWVILQFHQINRECTRILARCAEATERLQKSSNELEKTLNETERKL